MNRTENTSYIFTNGIEIERERKVSKGKMFEAYLEALQRKQNKNGGK